MKFFFSKNLAPIICSFGQYVNIWCYFFIFFLNGPFPIRIEGHFVPLLRIFVYARWSPFFFKVVALILLHCIVIIFIPPLGKIFFLLPVQPPADSMIGWIAEQILYEVERSMCEFLKQCCEFFLYAFCTFVVYVRLCVYFRPVCVKCMEWKYFSWSLHGLRVFSLGLRVFCAYFVSNLRVFCVFFCVRIS